MRYAINVVAINGSQRLYGSGVAFIQLGASGFSSRQKYGISTAAVTELFAVGAMKKARPGTGAAAMLDLDANGNLAQGTPGRGDDAPLSLFASYGIPRPRYIPPGVTVTMSNREVRIPADGRIVDISTEGEF